MRWILQLIDVFKYIYSRGIIYGDISCYNILLDKHLNVKLIDFTGSLINRSPLLALYLVQAQPLYLSTPQKDKIFAFGLACYYILIYHIAFYKLFNNNIKNRYKQRIFPELKSLGAFKVIIRGY